MDDFFEADLYHVPVLCKNCGGIMVFQGIGEYRCEDCGAVDYDDYGKVRRFIEQHRGVNAVQIETALGIPQKTIRRMLKEGRLEIAADSRSFLKCEMCGKTIRTGRYCPECEMNLHRKMEDTNRQKLKNKMAGVGMGGDNQDGRMRFQRKDR